MKSYFILLLFIITELIARHLKKGKIQNGQFSQMTVLFHNATFYHKDFICQSSRRAEPAV